jgi:ribonuclease R
VHETPKEEKLADLRLFLSELGLDLPGGDKPEAQNYAMLLAAVRDRPDSHLIQTVMLRSLNQAVYSPDNKGHFGLALAEYAHFTSPIRRYPDLLVHRAIRHILRSGKNSDFHYSLADMHSLGEHCSTNERRADEATRDVTDWLKCEYMMDKVGESFDGIVTSVLGFGLFVELADIYVEGLVHITSLRNDYYHFDAGKHTLTGEHSRKSYRLGDSVRVKVARVDLDDKKIDFEMLGDEGESLPSERPGRSSKKDSKKGSKRGARKSSKPKSKKSASEKGPRKKKKKSAAASTTKAASKQGAKKKRRRRRPKSKSGE